MDDIKEKIIVVLTSYPKRMKMIPNALKSMKNQSIKPEKVILYLDETEFDGQELSRELYEMEDEWFQICWKNEGLGVHGKYYYALNEYADNVVVTIDDDVIYDENCISDLVKGYRKAPACVICRRGKLISWRNNGDIAPYNMWYELGTREKKEPRYDIVALGVGAVLYPPIMSRKGIFNKDVILKHIPQNDDLWLRAVEAANGTKVLYQKPSGNDITLYDGNASGLYYSHNKYGGNDSQIASLKSYYGRDPFEKCRIADSLLEDDVFRMREEDESGLREEREDLYKKTNSIVIYGAGNVGRRFMDEMRSLGYSDKVEGFAVSGIPNVAELCEKPVRNISYYSDGNHDYFVGTGIRYQKEIEEALLMLGIEREHIFTPPVPEAKTDKYIEE